MMKLAVIDTFLLGDQVYISSFVEALKISFPNAQICLVSNSKSAEVTRLLTNRNVLSIEIPWSIAGWYRHPIFLLKILIKTMTVLIYQRPLYGMIGLNPRGGIVQSILLYAMGVKCVISRDQIISINSRGDLKLLFMGGYERHIIDALGVFLQYVQSSLGAEKEVLKQWPFIKKNNESRGGKIFFAPESSIKYKEWTGPSWELLSRQLRKLNYKTVLIEARGGGVNEQHAFDEVWRGSIAELNDKLDEAVLVLGVDSFVGHLAAAKGIPVVTLYLTATSKIWEHKYTPHSISIDPCRDLGISFKSSRICPNEITVDDVFKKVTSVLDAVRQENGKAS